MKVPFLKCHGSGNEFVLIDGRSEFRLHERLDFPELLSWIMDREGPVGADGVLYLTESGHADRKMEVFNPNGHKARMCLNGIRCAARYVLEQDPKSERMLMETDAGDIAVSRDADFGEGVLGYMVEPIDRISLLASEVPVMIPRQSMLEERVEGLWGQFLFTGIQVYTPHIVALVRTIDERLLEETGLLANEMDGLFPEGVNVSLVRQLDADSIYVRTYERDGIGLSLSCSSAMVASVCVLTRMGHLKEKEWIRVYNRGGVIRAKCSLSQDRLSFQARLLGPAVFQYRGELSIGERAVVIQEKYEEERLLYSRFLEKVRADCGEDDYLVKDRKQNLCGSL